LSSVLQRFVATVLYSLTHHVNYVSLSKEEFDNSYL